MSVGAGSKFGVHIDMGLTGCGLLRLGRGGRGGPTRFQTIEKVHQKLTLLRRCSQGSPTGAPAGRALRVRGRFRAIHAFSVRLTVGYRTCRVSGLA